MLEEAVDVVVGVVVVEEDTDHSVRDRDSL